MGNKYFLLVLSILLLVFASACKGGEGVNMTDIDFYIEGYAADNSKALADILSVEYDLQELLSFFGEINSNESIGYDFSDMSKVITINSANERFPIECLRVSASQIYYSVYKVKKGGYFYVFWSICAGSDLNEKPNDAMVYFAAYLASGSLKNADDFVTIQPNISTAEEVALIDPAFELNFLQSSKIVSYSLLQDGTVMEICYEWNNEHKSRRDLTVVSKEVTDGKNASLSAILLIDLP